MAKTPQRKTVPDAVRRTTAIETLEADLRYALNNLTRPATREKIHAMDDKAFQKMVQQAEAVFMAIDKATHPQG